MRDIGAETFYAEGMAGSVWVALGARLAAERRRRGWTLEQVEANGGPNYAVVRSHERGRIRTTRALERHVAAFDWSVPDLFRRAAPEAEALTDDVLALVAAYRRATSEGRRALLLIAAQLPVRRGVGIFLVALVLEKYLILSGADCLGRVDGDRPAARRGAAPAWVDARSRRGRRRA